MRCDRVRGLTVDYSLPSLLMLSMAKALSGRQQTHSHPRRHSGLPSAGKSGTGRRGSSNSPPLEGCPPGRGGRAAPACCRQVGNKRPRKAGARLMKGWPVLPDTHLRLSHLWSFPLCGNDLSKPLDSGLRRNDVGEIPALPGTTARAGPVLSRAAQRLCPPSHFRAGVCVPHHTFTHSGISRGRRQE